MFTALNKRIVIILVGILAILIYGLSAGQDGGQDYYQQYHQYWQNAEGTIFIPEGCVPSELVSIEQQDLVNGFSSIIHYSVDRKNWKLENPYNSTAELEDAINSHPSIDPTGCREVWSRNTDDQFPTLWVHNIDGSNPYTITIDGVEIKGIEADWGYTDKIAFVSDDGYLHITNAAGSFHNNLQLLANNPDWSHDGKYIAYTNSDGYLTIISTDYSSENGQWNNVECNNPRWDTEGENIFCFQKETGLVIYNSVSGDVQPVVFWVQDIAPDPWITNAAVLVQYIKDVPPQTWFTASLTQVVNFDKLPSTQMQLISDIDTESFYNQANLNPDWWAPNQ